MSVYLKSAEAISAQNTFNTEEFFDTVKSCPDETYFTAIEPVYKDFIKHRSLRRMSKVVKMGTACSLQVLKKADIENPDAIILGTGLGCPADTNKFLDQIINNDEQLLNPTAFIQSTHNTVSGQLALLLGCKNYNFTYTQKGYSFETALMDAFLMLNEEKYQHILVGGVDEMTPKVYELMNQAGCVKSSMEPVSQSKTKGFIPGEGGGFFMLSNKWEQDVMAKVQGVVLFEQIKQEQIPDSLTQILRENSLDTNGIDVVLSGDNGDIFNQKFYNEVRSLFKDATHTVYKHLTGDFYTASSLAMWLAAKIIEKQHIPEELLLNKKTANQINNVLIHSHTRAYGHAFVLLSKC